jgi:hypothetical protein
MGDARKFSKCPFCHKLDPKFDPNVWGCCPSALPDIRKVRSRSIDGCLTCSVVEQVLNVLDVNWRDTGDGECRNRRVPRYHGCNCYHFTLFTMCGKVALCYPFTQKEQDEAGSDGNTLELFVSEGKW